jgi:hypothetical protein
MNIRELTTWQRLSNLDLDVADAALPFSARLARDNGWFAPFAGRAIEEYRKFCFLAVHAGHPVTPSDDVDQVWHLHLLYSRHYWETLCRDTLEMPLHHGPTQGGSAEGRKYQDWYEDTLAAYRRYFGEPPKDLWPASKERFDARNDFIRVNRRDVVTLDRRQLRRGAIASLLGGGVLAMAHALAQVDGAAAPRSSAGIWVVLVAVFLVVAIFAAARRSGRGSARKQRKGARAAAAGGAGCASTSKTSNDGGPDAGDGGGTGCGSAGGCGGGGCGGS